MSYFLAAALGNVLAWGVHGAAWRWRERALTLMGFSGILGFLLCGFGTFVAAAFTLTDDIDRPESALVAEKWPQLWPLALFWIAMIAVAWRQAVVAKRERPQNSSGFAFLAFFAEVVLGVGVWIAIPILILILGGSFPTQGDARLIFTLSFWTTFFLMAIFRPLVVRYSSRFLKLMKAAKPSSTRY